MDVFPFLKKQKKKSNQNQIESNQGYLLRTNGKSVERLWASQVRLILFLGLFRLIFFSRSQMILFLCFNLEGENLSHLWTCQPYQSALSIP